MLDWSFGYPGPVVDPLSTKRAQKYAMSTDLHSFLCRDISNNVICH